MSYFLFINMLVKLILVLYRFDLINEQEAVKTLANDKTVAT